jgi:hypothetical protein
MSPFESKNRVWPFSNSQLTAGLRRVLGKQNLQVTTVWSEPIATRPAFGRIQGLVAETLQQDELDWHLLVLKQPQGKTRMGLAGVGAREIGVYTWLQDILPVKIPKLIAYDPGGDWLIFEALAWGLAAENWQMPNYQLAIDNLSTLHDSFWGLSEDLNSYTWIGKPFTTDRNVYYSANRRLLQNIQRIEQYPFLTPFIPLLEKLDEKIALITQTLSEAPQTLIHGDYWPGNIYVGDDGEQVLYDWQATSIGPGIIDLVSFVTKSSWHLGLRAAQANTLITRYQTQVEALSGKHWSAQTWNDWWDFGLMWVFLTEWFDSITESPNSVLKARWADLLCIWIQPLQDATIRQFGAPTNKMIQ